MSALAFILLVVTIAPAAAVILVTWRVGSRIENLNPRSAWIDELSVGRYAPMLRLLDDGELRFLCSHSSITPGLARQFRRQRTAIFRGYLRSLVDDFTRILAALKLVMAQANTDRPDLASLLIRSQLSLAACMVLIQAQLLLYTFGFGTVNVGALLNVFEQMRLELRTLVPRSLGSAL